MIGKVCCRTCVSLDKDYREMEPGNSGRYYHGCQVQGLIRRPILSESDMEHQSCDKWEASDEQKRENSSMAEEFERELQILYAKWKRIYEYGEQDLNCLDGLELNQLRDRIISQRRRITRCLLEQDYPSSYQLKIPALVDKYYMARRKETAEAASKALHVYEENKDYQWLIQKSEDLSEKERKQCGIYYALGYVEQLGNAIQQNDYILMRVHESPEYYIELFGACRNKVTQLMEDRVQMKILPARKKEDKNVEAQPQIPGQMDIFSFLAS